jgi:antitoxin ParD1/3/4
MAAENKAMPDRTSMNVSLPESLRAWVDRRVRAGSYANTSDYVRDLIHHDQEEHKDRIDEQAVGAIRQGIADLQAGRVTPAEELFQRLEERYRAL